MKYSTEKELYIINSYLRGKNTKQIALELNTYNTSIRRVLIRNKIQLRDNHNVRRYCKHNPFKKNDEYSDYFLGLLITDGCINKHGINKCINLSLSELDGYMVEKFKNWASPSLKVSKTLLKINNTYMYHVNISNNEAIEWLERKANFIRKSYSAKLYVPLNWNILRGIIDGDGSMIFSNKYHKISITSASITLIDLITFFLRKQGYHPVIQNRGNTYTLNIYRISEIISIGLNLYTNATIFLERKYLKWFQFYLSRTENILDSGDINIQS